MRVAGNFAADSFKVIKRAAARFEIPSSQQCRMVNLCRGMYTWLAIFDGSVYVHLVFSFLSVSLESAAPHGALLVSAPKTTPAS